MKIEEQTFKDTVEIAVDHSIINQPRVMMYAVEGRLVQAINCKNKDAAYRLCQQLTAHWLNIIKENE